MKYESKKFTVANRTQELKILRNKQAALLEQLNKEFTEAGYRELSCINQKITVRESQKKGSWSKNQPPKFTTI